MIELVWVTILSVYGQQRRERAGAVACALPGVAGEGGAFTADILRDMTVRVQSQHASFAIYLTEQLSKGYPGSDAHLAESIIEARS